MTIIIKTNRVLVAGPDVPVLRDFYNDVFDNPKFNAWVAKTARAVLSGSAVVSLAEEKTNGGQTLTPTSTKQPVWVPDAGDGRPTMTFVRQTSGVPDLFTMTGFPAGSGLSWTKFAIITAPTYNGQTNSGDLFSTETAGNRHALRIGYSTNNGDFFNVLIGAGTHLINFSWPNRPVDSRILVEMAWDGSTNTAYLSVNGAPFISSQATTAVPTGGDAACIADVTTCNFGALVADSSNNGFFGNARLFGHYVGSLANPANIADRNSLKALARSLGCASVV